MLVEHRGGVVDLGTTIRTFICDKALDRGTHPSRCFGAIRLEFLYPPILVSSLIVAELINGFLRPMPFVLNVGRETDLERTQICQTARRFRAHREAIANEKKKRN